MPDAGQLTEDRVPATGPVLAPLFPPPPWSLPGARVLKLMFETDKAPVLAWLPNKLTRSSPPYATIHIEHYPESPVGPFTVAHQFIGCRAGFFMRGFALQSVVDNPVALSALREVWGYPAEPGQVTLDVRDDAVRATVSANGVTICEASLESRESIDAEQARFDPALTLRLVPSLQEKQRHDLVQLLQIDPEITIREAHRGRGAVTYPGEANSNTWAVLPNRNMISAVYATVDTELPLARFVMPY